MDVNPPIELAALSDLSDYRVCRDNSDPRGWQIIDADAVPVGTAKDLDLFVYDEKGQVVLKSELNQVLSKAGTKPSATPSMK